MQRVIAANHVVLEEVVDLAHLLIHPPVDHRADTARILVSDTKLHHASILVERLEVVPVKELVIGPIKRFIDGLVEDDK